MTMDGKMTLEQVRDWLLARANDGQMQRSVYVSDYQLREMADAIESHLAQPPQPVDVDAIREVIGDLREWGKTDEQLAKRAEWLTAALQEKGNG